MLEVVKLWLINEEGREGTLSAQGRHIFKRGPAQVIGHIICPELAHIPPRDVVSARKPDKNPARLTQTIGVAGARARARMS